MTRTLRLRLRFANPDFKLKPNMFAQITILSNSRQDTLLVPREAVIRTGSSDRVVLALGDGKFRSTPVSIGRVSHTQTEILNGVTEGQEIVSSAQFLLDSESSKTADLQRLDSGTSPPPNSQPMDHSQMDHSQIHHSQMHHSQMQAPPADHQQMNHDQMNHDQMNHDQMNHDEMNHNPTNQTPTPERSHAS